MGGARDNARRMAVLAVYQEWLVARSMLVGQVLDLVQRLRPGYVPEETLEQLRRTREVSKLAPETEALDANALLQLAALLHPQEVLLRQVDELVIETFRTVTQLPSYQGRPDLLPPLRRGLAALRAIVARSIHMARFRSCHVAEARMLASELKRRQQAKSTASGLDPNGYQGMWVRAPASSESKEDVSARSINDRLYAGQLVQPPLPWLPDPSSSTNGTGNSSSTGPRGLRQGRMGVASFRPLPGATLYGYPGCPGDGSFGSTVRVQFNELDQAMRDQAVLIEGIMIPAAVSSVFTRLHRTALLDMLSAWPLKHGLQLESMLYQPSCKHAVALRAHAPLLVSRRTTLLVFPGKELQALRSLVRQRGPEVLSVVHPHALKQATQKGEWQYWLEAHRLWGRFVDMPNVLRSAALVLVPPSAALAGVRPGDSQAAEPSSAPLGAGRSSATLAKGDSGSGEAAALSSLDQDGVLTSLSSFDSEDDNLPSGQALLSSAAAGAGNAAGSSLLQTSGPSEPLPVRIQLPANELRDMMEAILELVPGHISHSAGSSGLVVLGGITSASGNSLGGFAGPGPWLPSNATRLQIRYSPPTGAEAGSGSSRGGASLPPAAAPSSSGREDGAGAPQGGGESSSSFEVRWDQGRAATFGRPSQNGRPAPSWSAPMRLSQDQLVSLINIFSDLGQQVPECFTVSSLELHVPTLTPMGRALSAARGVLGAVVRAVGLCALLAVPLAGAIKAGHLNSLAQASEGLLARRPRMAVVAGQTSAAADSDALAEAHSRATPEAGPAALSSEELDPATAGTAGQQAAQEQAQPLGSLLSTKQLAKLCRQVEAQLSGKVWLEVTGTSSALLLPPLPPQPQNQGQQEAAAAATLPAAPQPVFQVLVDGTSSSVLGCSPVNDEAVQLYQRLPLSALLRSKSMQAALDKHAQAVRKGKAAPDSISVPYESAQQHPLPSSASPEASVAVLRLELQAIAQPEARMVHGKGRKAREFTVARPLVRPWHDSDSLLWWLGHGVQLPTLAEELQGGLLADEETRRTAFDKAYARLVAQEALAASAAVPSAPQPLQAAAAVPAVLPAVLALTQMGTRAPDSAGLSGAAGLAGLQAQQQPASNMSQQELQQAVQQMLKVLGVSSGNLKVTATRSGNGGQPGQGL